MIRPHHAARLLSPLLAAVLACEAGAQQQRPASRCASGDAEAAAAVRARLGAWVGQVKANDRAGMREVWAPDMVGWSPSAAVFSDSAAFAAAGLQPANRPAPRVTYEIAIDDLVAAGDVVVVHDLWTETRELGGDARVRRTIRGSELWRCQPDGRWRIARYVSAPEPWTLLAR